MKDMKTHEVEQLLGISKQALIYYEKEGLIKPQRNENNYRNYNQNDLEILKMIMTLRSLEISIDDIKLIFANELTLKNCLQTKRNHLQLEKDKINQIEKGIDDCFKRIKVFIHSNQEVNDDYINLYYLNNEIRYNDVVIKISEIESIDLSLCCSKGEDGKYYGIYNLYFIYLDINTNLKTYCLQLINNDEVTNFFDYLLSFNLTINDPLKLINAYHKHNDPMQLYKYFNRNFKQWQKEYNLELKDFYWQIIKNDYMLPLQELKDSKQPVPSFKEQIKSIFKGYLGVLKKPFSPKK